jgi:hypothetical protein
MTEQEKLVRETWETVYEYQTLSGQDLVAHGPYTSYTWAAAAEYTRERLEQIRLVEEEILWLGAAFNSEWSYWKEKPLRERILAARQAALAELKRGMK